MTRYDESRWHEELILSAKDKIKQQLDQAFAPTNAHPRLRFIQAEIRRLAAVYSPLGQLERFIYVVTALVHHQRYGGLKPRQVRQLIELGSAILQAQGIKPRSSRLSHLHAELHQITSQICRQEGSQWQAAWEQSYSNWLGQGHKGPEPGFAALGMANRALRLGHSRFAIAGFAEAEQLGLAPANFGRARLGRIKSLRLAGSLEQCLALAYLTRLDERLSDAASRELGWEETCANVQTTADLAPLRACVVRGKCHYESTYLIEAFLWSACSSRTNAREGMPKLSYIARDPRLKPQRLGFFYQFALQLERCYLTEMPLTVRIRQLGKLLAETGRLVSVDKELLAWAASARWLARSKSYALASLALNEYEALSLRLSNGTHHDSLGLMADMLARDWYTGKTADFAYSAAPATTWGESA